MKALSYLLSIYMLALTLMPCDDITSNTNNSPEQLTKIALHDNNQLKPAHEQEDHCSPLCLCNCCQNIVYIPQYLDFSYPDTLPKSYREYLISLNGLGYFDFLKPPRL